MAMMHNGDDSDDGVMVRNGDNGAMMMAMMMVLCGAQ